MSMESAVCAWSALRAAVDLPCEPPTAASGGVIAALPPFATASSPARELPGPATAPPALRSALKRSRSRFAEDAQRAPHPHTAPAGLEARSAKVKFQRRAHSFIGQAAEVDRSPHDMPCTCDGVCEQYILGLRYHCSACKGDGFDICSKCWQLWSAAERWPHEHAAGLFTAEEQEPDEEEEGAVGASTARELAATDFAGTAEQATCREETQ